MAVKTFTTGEVLTAADTNTYLNNGGLVYITEASATSGTVLGINGCFTATYDDYLVEVRNATCAATSGMNIKLRASGTPSSASYYYGGYYVIYGSTSIQATSSANTSSIDSGCVADATNPGYGMFNIIGPYITKITGFDCRGNDPRTGGGGGRIVTGYHNSTSAYDGIEIVTTQTITNMTLRIYGYRKA